MEKMENSKKKVKREEKLAQKNTKWRIRFEGSFKNYKVFLTLRRNVQLFPQKQVPISQEVCRRRMGKWIIQFLFLSYQLFMKQNPISLSVTKK